MNPPGPWACVARPVAAQPDVEVQALDDMTFALRQAGRLTWEAPISYLLLGSERALLLDTGARPGLADTVDRLRADLDLVVAHTHGHSDHTSGDPSFALLARTTVVAKEIEAVRAAFGTAPGTTARYDLGGRPLLLAETPGHDARSICVLDPGRRFLLTGDLVYPGRLSIDDLDGARASLDLLVALAAEHDVKHVLGSHVELDAHGRLVPLLARVHPDERLLSLGRADLEAVRDAVHACRGPGIHPGHPMTLFVGPCVRARLASAARGLLARR